MENLSYAIRLGCADFGKCQARLCLRRWSRISDNSALAFARLERNTRHSRCLEKLLSLKKVLCGAVIGSLLVLNSCSRSRSWHGDQKMIIMGI